MLSLELTSDISRDDTGFALLLIKLGGNIFSIKISRRGFKFDLKEVTPETAHAITIPKELEPFANSFSDWFILHVVSSAGNEPKSMFTIIKDQIFEVFAKNKEDKEYCYLPEIPESESKSVISTSSLHVYLKNSGSDNEKCVHNKDKKNSSDHLYLLFTLLDLGSSFSFGLLKIVSDTQVVEIFINLKDYKNMVIKELVDFQEDDKYELSKANGALFDADKLKKIVIGNKSAKFTCSDIENPSIETLPKSEFKIIKIFECFEEKTKGAKSVIMTCNQVSEDQFKIILIIPDELNKEKLKNSKISALDLEFNLQKYNSYDQVEKIQPKIEKFLELFGEFLGQETSPTQRKLVSY